jgi:glycosyltransferase involved in cell wall biosynthesis
VVGAVRELAQRTEGITLFAVSCPHALKAVVEFVPVPCSMKHGLQAVSFGVGCAAVLASRIRQKSLDIVYTRYFRSVLAPITMAKAAGVPVVVEVNSSLVNERRNAGLARWASVFEQLEERAVFSAANGAVAVTRAIELELQRRHPAAKLATAVVENGVDTAVYRPLDRDECRNELGLPLHAQYVLFAGAYQVWQGVLDLLEAFALASVRVPNLQLLMIGDGPERERILALIAKLNLEKRVILCGFQEEKRLARYIACADVCVAPYNTDAVDDAEVDKHRYGARMRGSPLKVLTYMACARPIVTTHLAEAGAYLADRGLGVAVPPEDAGQLADAIVTLLEDAPRAQAMAQRALQVACRDHTWASVATQYLALVERACQR